MKKILLAAGGNAGLLRCIPLFTALGEQHRYEVAFAGSAPAQAGAGGEDLPALFGVADAYVAVETGSGSAVRQTVSAMTHFDQLLAQERPDFMMIAGDNDLALSAALCASSHGVAYAALDAGLRTGDRNSAVERNRRMIDAVADVLFVSEHSGLYNLVNEGVDEERIFFTGNLAIDSLAAMMPGANSSEVLSRLGLEEKRYALVLLCDPFLHDSLEDLKVLEHAVRAVAERQQVLMLLDSEVEALLQQHEMLPAFTSLDSVLVIPRTGYSELLRLVKDALFVMTDSSLAQAESTVMKVPCLTMRTSTVSPVTVERGSNMLVGDGEDTLLQRIGDALDGKLASRTKIPEKWDGASSQRVIEVLDRLLLPNTRS